MSDSSATVGRKQRRARPQLSCAECRRLKLKCDRQVPCANCCRRDCAALCPSGVRQVKPPANDDTGVKDRLQALEDLISQHGITVPPSVASGSKQMAPSGQGTAQKRPRIESARAESARIDSESTRSRESPNVGEGDHRPHDAGPLFAPSPQRRGLVPAGSGGSLGAGGLALPPSHTLPTWEIDPAQDQHNFFPPFASVSPHRVRFEYNMPTTSSHTGTSPSMRENVSTTSENAGAGTLVIGRGGRSKYLGPTAASEWLKDSELQEQSDSPIMSRMPSPDTVAEVSNERPASTFPFSPAASGPSSAELYARLPPRSEANATVDSFYRSFAWHYNVAPRASFQKVFEAVYRQRLALSKPRVSPAPPLSDLQDLALVFMTMAHGCLHNLEFPPNDPVAETYAASGRAALSKGNLLSMPTISGIQALHILAHYQLDTEQGRNGDATWPLWGLAMRLILSMGLHRDGGKWDLEPEVIEQRRRVFWECQAADVFQANCFSRPSSLWPGSYDTAYPAEPADDDAPTDQKGFYTLKFELSRISCSILSVATRVEDTPYSHILQLYEELSTFERAVPFRLRCRAAMTSLPSLYPDPQMAIDDSPAPINRDLCLSFQQFTLAINISETVLFLHRPYFARALHARKLDAARTEFGPSYLAVVERSSAIIQCVAALHQMHRIVSCRHWALWYHAFNSAVCLGTLVINDPTDPLASFAMTQIEAAITVYTSAVQSGSSSRLIKNLQWLIRLRARASEELARPHEQASGNEATPNDPAEVELLGWRTRLIQRAAHGERHVATTIGNTVGISPQTAIDNTLFQALQQHLSDTTSSGVLAPIDAAIPAPDNTQPATSQSAATDSLLHSFWDPMMLQDFPDVGSSALSNWWDMLPRDQDGPES